MTGLIYSIFLLHLFTKSEAIPCFECQHVPFPRDCMKVTECSADEYCFTEQIVTARGLLVYNSGCMAKPRCSAIGVPLVGKRSENRVKRASTVTTCVECCATSFCNMNGCGVPEIPAEQRGPYCFSCDEIPDPMACKNVSICLQNEVCMLLSLPQSRDVSQTLYKGLCGQQSTCDQLSTTLNTKACAASCCRTDFCNDRCPTFENSSLSNETIHTGYSSTIPTVAYAQTVNTTTIPPVAYTQTGNTTTIPTVAYTQTVNTTTIPPVAYTQTGNTTTIPTVVYTQTGNTTTLPSVDYSQKVNNTTIPSVSQELTIRSSSISPSTSKAPLQCLHRNGYVFLNNSHTRLCVHIVAHHATWDHARSQCKKEGADLVVLNTHGKAFLLRHALARTPEYNSHSSYWIGAMDFAQTNHFRWVNNERVKESEADWAPGQPDLASQDCVMMVNQLSFRWNNRLCHEDTNYICERSLK